MKKSSTGTMQLTSPSRFYFLGKIIGFERINLSKVLTDRR